MKMRKIMILVITVFIFIMGIQNVFSSAAQTVCQTQGDIVQPPIDCTDVKLCGNHKCQKAFVDAKTEKVSECATQNAATCNGVPASSCPSVVQTFFSTAANIIITAGTTAASQFASAGVYSDAGCGQMNDCMLKSAENGALQSFEKIGNCGFQIEKGTHEQLLKKYGDKAAIEFNRQAPQALEAIKGGYQFQTSQTYEKIMTGLNKADIDIIANNQKWSFSAEESVRQINSKLGAEHSFFNQIGVMAKVISNNPIVQTVGAISTVFGLFETGKKIVDFVAGNDEEDEEQSGYRGQTYQTAQNDINNAQNSQAQGTSQWTNCPGHRDGRCSGQAVCVTDSNSGASQCIAALPGQHVTVRFGSIHVIDTEQNNMFTLTGAENDGVVYQQDGFVNIDKGGTTKISVAGQGALITNWDNNKLYLGRGTTIYFGNGNEYTATYLTNTFILDYNSKVAVNAVNGIEQNKFKESTSKGNLKQNIELALTLNKNNLKPYKNALDIGNLQGQYQLLTRGFSNIVLVEKDKIFPLMSRNFAKGDSLIVKNKNVKVPYNYKVNDGSYEYTIKTIGDSTKILTENEKVIQDSGQLNYKLTRRQALLIYNA